jgi:hypothetical protein
MKFPAIVLCVFVIVLGAAVFAADEPSNIQDRVTELVSRWLRGDKAARAGVATETIELGDAAIQELYARVAPDTFDFPGKGPGVVFSEQNKRPSFDSIINIEAKFIQPAKGVKITARAAIVNSKLADGGNQISAPRLSVYDGQRANMSIARQQEYVRTFAKGEEVPGTVQTGLVMDVRASVEGAKISCEIRVARAELDGEVDGKIGEVQTAAGKVGAPSVIKREFAVTLLLDPDETVTLAVPGAEPMLIQLKATPVKR